MKSFRFMLVLFACLLITGPALAGSAAVTFAGGDGSSFEKAILIQNATEDTGVKSEYTYLEKHFPGYSVGRQSLVTHEGRVFDVLEIGAKNEPRKIYFDITEFFGKN